MSRTLHDGTTSYMGQKLGPHPFEHEMTSPELEAALLDAAREISWTRERIEESDCAKRETEQHWFEHLERLEKERDELRAENQKLRAKIEKIKDRLDSHMNESGLMACAKFASDIENIVLHEPTPETHGDGET